MSTDCSLKITQQSGITDLVRLGDRFAECGALAQVGLQLLLKGLVSCLQSSTVSDCSRKRKRVGTLGKRDSSSRMARMPRGFSNMVMQDWRSIPKSTISQSIPSFKYSSCSSTNLSRGRKLVETQFEPKLLATCWIRGTNEHFLKCH